MKRLTLFFGTLFLSAFVLKADPAYVLSTFNLSAGFYLSQAAGQNENGAVVGAGLNVFEEDPPTFTHFVYQNGSFTTIPGLSTSYSSGDGAIGINNSGYIVGIAGGVASGSSGGSWTSLGSLGGTVTTVRAVNNNGVAVGDADTVGNTAAVAVSYSGGVATALGNLGGVNSLATAISDSGRITGSSEINADADPTYHAFSYMGGVMTDLGSLNGASGNSQGYGINEAGDIVGSSDNTIGGSSGFLYKDGVLSDLGTLDDPSFVGSLAYDINNHGDIVGAALDDFGDTVALLIDGAGNKYNLNELFGGPLITLQVALGINDAGQIFGIATDENGAPTGFVLSQVPEPSTYLMLGLGLGLLFWFKRRKTA